VRGSAEGGSPCAVGAPLTPSSVLPGGHAGQQQEPHLPQAVTRPDGPSRHIAPLVDASSRGHTTPTLVLPGAGDGSDGTAPHSCSWVWAWLGGGGREGGLPRCLRGSQRSSCGGHSTPRCGQDLLLCATFPGGCCASGGGDPPPINSRALPLHPQQLPDAFSTDTGGMGGGGGWHPQSPAPAAPVRGQILHQEHPGLLHWVPRLQWDGKVWGEWGGGPGRPLTPLQPSPGLYSCWPGWGVYGLGGIRGGEACSR